MPAPGTRTITGGGLSPVGQRADPYGAFNFWVEVGNLVVGGFSEVTGLTIETELVEHREGGLNNYAHLLPGPTKYPERLVLKRGITSADTLWAWYMEVLDGVITRRNVTVYVLQPTGARSLSWTFVQAYPVRWSGPELRAGGSEIAVESLSLAHQGIQWVR